MFWETPTSTRHYTYEGRDVSVNTLSNKLESVGEKFSTDVLPPIRRSGLQGLPEKGCVNLAKTYLHGTYSSSSLRFSLLAPNESYEIKGDSICRTSASPSTAPDSVILEVRATEGGLLRSFMRKSVATSVDTSQFLQACPLWPKEQP